MPTTLIISIYLKISDETKYSRCNMKFKIYKIYKIVYNNIYGQFLTNSIVFVKLEPLNVIKEKKLTKLK